MDRLAGKKQASIYYKPFYTRADFSDERYSPVFTPQVYSGQTMEMWVFFDQWTDGEGILVSPYFRTVSDHKLHTHGFKSLEPSQWQRLSCQIEDTNGDLIDEVGLLIEGDGPASKKTLGKLYLSKFRIYGKAEYTLDMRKQRNEFSTITPFSVNGGDWRIEEDRLCFMCYEESMAYAGNYYAKDVRLSAEVRSFNGDGIVFLLRARGAAQSYMAGFKDGMAAIWKQDFGISRLDAVPFQLLPDRSYAVTFQAKGTTLILEVDGRSLLQVEDSTFRYGMWGLGAQTVCRGSFWNIHVKEL